LRPNLANIPYLPWVQSQSMRIPIDASLSLSQVTMADAPALVRYLNHPAIHQNTLKIPFPYTLNDAGWYVNYLEERRQKLGRLTEWAIRDESGQLIGGAGFHVEHGLGSHKDAIGYWLGAPFWGKGIMTRVVNKMVEIGFGEWGLVRLEAPVFLHNLASTRVLEKNGFQAEGILKSYYLKGSHPVDVKMYALVRSAQEAG